MFDSPLPDGVTRNEHCICDVTLETCHAMCFYFRYPDGRDSLIIVWKDLENPNIRPVSSGKRLRDLRPGDEVVVVGKSATLTGVEIYR